jgi:amidase
MLIIKKETRTYFYDPVNKPVASAAVKDQVLFETVDCFDGQLKSEKDLAHEIDMSHMNPTTGPLHIDGTEPGDILVIKILDIEPADHAVATLIPGEGVLQDRAPGPVTKVFPIKNRETVFNQDIVIKPRLMVGTIGTTPLDRTPTGLPGDHGGNIDVPTVGIDSTVYLPVFLPGALLQMGDAHSAMGDGEICIGMEIGAEVTIEILEVIKNRFLPGPVVENEETWGIVADARTFEDAVRLATRRTAAFLTQKLELTFEEAALLISTACDVKLAQWADANYNTVVYVEIPKYLDKKRRLFAF